MHMFLQLNTLKNRYLQRIKKYGQLQQMKGHSLVLLNISNRRVRSFSERVALWLQRNKPFYRVVLIPWLIAACYIGLIQSPQYESDAKILIEHDDDKTPFNLSLGLLGNSASGNSSTTVLTQEFIMSREMFATMQHLLDIKNHYQSKKIDWFSRLEKNPTQKDLLRYYQKKFTAVVDPETNEINISVRAFTPQDAKKFIIAVIEQSKNFVNRVSNSLADKQFHFAKLQLHLAKQKLFAAEKSILEFQNSHGMFDPKETARVVAEVMAQLKGDLVKKQTELITFESYMQPESSKVVAIKEEIEALKNQIERQTNELLGRRDGEKNKLNQIMVDYEWQELHLKFAQAEYQSAQQAYDSSNINLAKQLNMVIEVAAPNLPDDYEYPHIFYDLVDIFILLVIIFLLGKMTFIIIQEHVD